MKYCYLLLILLLFSCGKEKKIYFDSATIQKLTSTEPGLPSFYEFYMFAGKEGGTVCRVDINFLKYLYTKNGYDKEFDNFESFVANVFNLRLDLKEEDFIDNGLCFTPDVAIASEFEQSPDKAIAKYWDDKKTDGLWLKPQVIKSVSGDALNTILFYCWLNNYRVYYAAMANQYYMRPF